MSQENTSTGGWKARPVFISSTFKDMQQERDWLRNHVFDRIAEELRKRRHHLEPIDLRLGVETAHAGTEEARELLVLKVCLDEIKRSRPFLLVLLGGRYGWVPPPERIATAAREQGFESAAAGKSVTALEIEFGILKEDKDQQHRSLFFFRRPLPWKKLPEGERANYSDAHSSDREVRAGHDKLVTLKDRLRTDPELGPHVFDYSADWDADNNKVTGLKAFGDLVFEKLWAAIDEETRGYANQPPPTWEEQEKAAIAEFVEHRSRIFVGREELIRQLLGIARSPIVEGTFVQPASDAPLIGSLASSKGRVFTKFRSEMEKDPSILLLSVVRPPAIEGPIGGTTWGACVVGSPGSGKSAVFAKLHRELEKDAAILILANAAGGTQRGGSVDAMLRRFIAELAAAGRVANPLPENPSPDDVEAAFYSLLRRVSSSRRVMVLLDALDQSEPTPRGRHLTWFKAQQWPPNARIVATSLSCPAAEVLCRSDGIKFIELPALTAGDAGEIGRQVWGRYHRELNPAVLKMLVDKSHDGESACGNPLWLTLALEQLNLLDADDFARAEREFAGSATERMAALLMDTAARMPPEIGGLYGWLLEQNERAFGIAHARGFAMAIALSRSGWREADLIDLVPRLGKLLFPNQTVPALDDLTLATLRRGFRAHLVRRGENGQLDFFHAQMRQAMIARCAPDEQTRRTLHAAISDYLEGLPADDPMILLERMGQLIGERNALRAARYYATLDVYSEPSTERVGATWALVDWIAAAELPPKENVSLNWIASWLDASGLESEEIHRLAYNFQFGLFERMANEIGLGARQHLIEAVRAVLERLAASDPSNAIWQRDLFASLSKLGDVKTAQGNLASALQAYQQGMEIAGRVVSADTSSAQGQRDLSVSFDRIGDVKTAQGDLAGALRVYQQGMEIVRKLAAVDPTNTQGQRALSVSFERIGDVKTAQGDLAGALQAYQFGMEIVRKLAAADPTNAQGQRDLSVSFDRIGNVKRAQGDLAGALLAYQQSMEIRLRLAAADPTNAGAQRDLSISFNEIGDAKKAQGDLAGAMQAYQQGMEIRRRLGAADPTNAQGQRDLSVSFERIGDVKKAEGDLAGALQAYQYGMEIGQKLAAADPTNAQGQRGLWVSFNKIGDVKTAQGDLAGALQGHQQGMGIARRLAAADPTDAQGRRDLSISFNKIGDVKTAQGDLAGALQAYQHGMEIGQRLAAADPTNAQGQGDLSISFKKIGDVKSAQGDLAGAMQAYQQGMGIDRKLGAADPTNALRQRDLSVSFNNIGDAKTGQGNLAGALEAYQQGMEIRLKLAAADPTNAQGQRDLFVSSERIGNVKTVQGDLAGALRAYEQGMEIARTLAATDPTNAQGQRDLSVSLGRIGEIKTAQRDLAGALHAYQQTIEICGKLAAADPTNALVQRDLFVTYAKLAQISEQTNAADARNWWRRAYDQLSGMKQRGVMLPTDEKLLPILRQKAGG